MPEENKEGKVSENPLTDGKKKNTGDEKEKKPEVIKDTGQTKQEPSSSSEGKAGSQNTASSRRSSVKPGDSTNKDKPKEPAGQKGASGPTKPDNKQDDRNKMAEKSGSKPADKLTSVQSKTPSEQKMRRPTIAISGSDSGSEDLVKSTMQKARRASIRAKGRASSISHGLLAQTASRRISTADVAASLEADNVWDLAVKMKQVSAELSDPDEGQRESTLIVLGGKQSGKTTVIGQLLDSEEPARRTLGLDYTYARRAGGGISRDVCQIWELGGGTAFLQLLDTPVRAERLSDTACVIVVDLTHPETILPTVEATTGYLAELIDKKLREAGTTGVLVRNLLTSQLNSRRPEQHPDASTVKPLLIPIALVGGMYDKLQPLDVPAKKVVAEAMRWAAHKHFASLLYFSSKEVALRGRAKDLLTHLAFGAEANPRQSLDVQKPLQIAAGADSFRAIAGGGDGSQSPAAVLSRVSQRWPPPPPEAAAVPDDPSRDELFAESDVDGLRADKLKELDRLRQDLERRRRMALERAAAERLKGRAPAAAAVSKQAAQRAAAEFLERHHGAATEEAKGGDRPTARPDGQKAEAKADPKTGVNPEKKDTAKMDTKPVTKPTTKLDTKTGLKQVKSDAKADAKPADKSDGKNNTKTHGKADTKSAVKPDAALDTKPPAKSDVKPDTKPRANADGKNVAKPETKADANSGVKN